MFKVQFRDATKPDQVLAGTLFLPFAPQLQQEVRIRRGANDVRHDTYRVVGHIYEVVQDNPGESGIVVLVAKAG